MSQSYPGPYVVTPTESGKTLATARKTLRQNIIIDPIPADYVGPKFKRKSGTVIVPSEKEQVAVHKDTYTTGDVKVAAIPSKYYDMTGKDAWMGAGAELVTTFTLADVKLSATSFASWTPSTTASDILATRNAGTFVADMTNYEYYLVWETGIPVVVPAATTKKALPIFTAAYQVQQLFRRPGSYAQIESENFSTAACISAYTNNFIRYYGTTQNSATYSWGLSYALYATLTAATFSSTTADSPTVTVKSPKISARCSTTYMSTTSAAAIDQDATIISQKCKVYRVKKQTGFIRGVYEGNVDFINELIGD